MERVGVSTKASAEDQYFTREIDRDTFVKIMTEQHNKVLELRSMIEEKERELRGILSARKLLGRFGGIQRI
jgi:hypothetical protein